MSGSRVRRELSITSPSRSSRSARYRLKVVADVVEVEDPCELGLARVGEGGTRNHVSSLGVAAAVEEAPQVALPAGKEAPDRSTSSRSIGGRTRSSKPGDRPGPASAGRGPETRRRGHQGGRGSIVRLPHAAQSSSWTKARSPRSARTGDPVDRHGRPARRAAAPAGRARSPRIPCSLEGEGRLARRRSGAGAVPDTPRAVTAMAEPTGRSTSARCAEHPLPSQLYQGQGAARPPPVPSRGRCAGSPASSARRSCVDILQQTAALRGGDRRRRPRPEDHVQGCVRTAAERGEADQYVDEVIDVVRRTLGRPVRGSPQPAERRSVDSPPG